ncbi:hypothetical protein [Kribbella pratensis]|uniref:hypothetical protein n=1 Tax=Kribbella pratensis TaxID=2512112 RepID=UPI0010668821|nr:hypothetical protein [Kribbella pratensis]
MKSEQLERIKQRDSFLNLNVVAIGLTASLAIQLEGRQHAWLLIPWITTILGWAYLSNDDKVTAIARHLEQNAGISESLGLWESSTKGLTPSALRRTAEIVVFLIAFVAPTPVSVALYLSSSHADPIRPLSWILIGSGSLLTAGLALTYSSSLVGRWRSKLPPLVS